MMEKWCFVAPLFTQFLGCIVDIFGWPVTVRNDDEERWAQRWTDLYLHFRGKRVKGGEVLCLTIYWANSPWYPLKVKPWTRIYIMEIERGCTMYIGHHTWWHSVGIYADGIEICVQQTLFGCWCWCWSFAPEKSPIKALLSACVRDDAKVSGFA